MVEVPALRVLLGTQFGLFFAGNGVSLVGSWMQRIACSWLVWQWTGSAFWLGVLAAGDLLPVVVVGPFAGVAADRWDRLKQNRIVQTASALVALVIAGLLLTGWLGLWSLIGLVTLQGTLIAAIQPARLAMVQQMVPRADMGVAVALNSVNVNLARLIGPAVAGVMILHFDILWVFLANAAVTFLFVVVLGRLRLTPRLPSKVTGGLWRQMGDGFAHVLAAPALWMILLVLFCGGAVVRAMLELVPAIAAASFTDTATGLAILTGASGVGATIAGLTVTRRAPGQLLLAVLVWWILGAVAAVALTQTPVAALAVLAAAALGGAITRGLVGTQTFVQLTTPDALRGRVLSVHGLISRGSPALGALALGWSADRFGLPVTVFWASAGLVLVLLALLPALRRIAALVGEAA